MHCHSQVVDGVERGQTSVGSLVDRCTHNRSRGVGHAHGARGGDLGVGLGSAQPGKQDTKPAGRAVFM